MFFNQKVCRREAALNAFVNVMTSCENGLRFAFHEAHWLKLTRRFMSYVKQSYWEYSMRCQCHASVNVEASEGMHRQITFCSGPVLRRNVTQVARVVSRTDQDVVDQFVLQCRELWPKRRDVGGL